MKRGLRRFVLCCAMVGAMGVLSGCASLSLFSSTHTHHHGVEDETKQKVEELEDRISALERAQKAGMSR